MTSGAAPDKAAVLLEALPYIRTWRRRTIVVKVGGQALDDPASASVVAEDLALLSLVGVQLVVVHGGGPQVSDAMRAAGVQPSFVDGLRVTDDTTMEIVRRVLVGSINNDLVARLARAGLQAVGLTGADGATVIARKLTSESGDLGRVGEVDRVDAGLLTTLLERGYTPLLASVAPDAQGDPLNVNADAVAGAVAGSLQAEKLVYLTNVEGLYRDLGDAGSLISEMKSDELRSIAPSLSSGMQPKAISILAALEQGVGKAHILDGRVPHALLLEIFTDEGIGTQVLP
ncbi:MAG TPA: acetylglutamate kinase [Actinomycetota bacterium]|nr:acetylglutamate kinase [Actinomycetota bacterium]